MKINVIPRHDLREHEEHEGCACCPRVEQHGENALIIHSAWDQREVLEQSGVSRGRHRVPGRCRPGANSC